MGLNGPYLAIPTPSTDSRHQLEHTKGYITKKPFKSILRGVKSAIFTPMTKHLTFQKRGLKHVENTCFFRV